MSGSYSVTINVVDKATAQIDAMNRRLANFAKPYEKLNASLAKFGKASGLEQVGKGFAAIGRSALDAFRAVTRIVEPLAAITGAASIAGMYKLVQSWADWGSRLGWNAERIGMNADALLQYQNAARLAGVSAEAMTGGLEHLKDTMTDALGGRNNEALAYFSQMGISMKDLQGTAESVLPRIAQRIGELEKANPTLANRLTQEFFGSGELLRVFRNGNAGLERYLQLAGKLGHTSEADIKRADSMRESFAALSISVEMMGNSIASKLQPVLQPLIDNLTAHMPAISRALSGAILSFVTYLEHVDWKGVLKDFDSWRDRIQRVVTWLGGTQQALIDLAAIFAAGFVLKMLSPFFLLAGALDTVIGKFVQMGVQAALAQKKAAAAGGVGVGGAASKAAPVAAETAEGTAEGAAAGAAAGRGGFLMRMLRGMFGFGRAAAPLAEGAAGVAADGTVAAGGLAIAPVAIATAAVAALAYFGPHALSWMFGQGYNATGIRHQGNDPTLPQIPVNPHANAAGRGNIAATDNQAKRDIAQLMGLGRTHDEAAAMVGNFYQESSLDEHAQNNKSGAYGLAQWLSKDRVANFSQVEGVDLYHSTRQQQLDFANWELTHTHRRALDDMRRAATVAAKSHAFGMDFEGYGAGEEGYRDGYSERYANLAGGPEASMAGQDGANGTVTVHVKAEPGTSAQVKKTTGQVKAAPPGVARTQQAEVYST